MTELTHLLLDWHHWAFEVVSGAILGATLTPLWRWLTRRHDRKAHPAHDHTNVYMEIEMLRMEVWALKQGRR